MTDAAQVTSGQFIRESMLKDKVLGELKEILGSDEVYKAEGEVEGPVETGPKNDTNRGVVV